MTVCVSIILVLALLCPRISWVVRMSKLAWSR